MTPSEPELEQTDNRPRPEDGPQDDLPQEPGSVYEPPADA